MNPCAWNYWVYRFQNKTQNVWCKSWKKNGSFHKNTSVSSPNRIFTIHFFHDFLFSSETLRTNVFNFTQNSFLHWNLTEILTLTIHWIWLFWIQLLFLYCKIRARAFEWFQKLVFHQKVLNLNFHWKKKLSSRNHFWGIWD